MYMDILKIIFVIIIYNIRIIFILKSYNIGLYVKICKIFEYYYDIINIMILKVFFNILIINFFEWDILML